MKTYDLTKNVQNQMDFSGVSYANDNMTPDEKQAAWSYFWDEVTYIDYDDDKTLFTAVNIGRAKGIRSVK